MATAEQRSRAASKAAHDSWGRTPDRQARTRAAIEASPVHIDYWIKKVREEGVVREQDVPAAAENKRAAWRKRNGEKSAKTRAKTKETARANLPRSA
jgi:hypothetical protein